MTQDEIIEMAKQAGFAINELHCSPPIITFVGQEEVLEAFAKLVAQHEREACAKLCWSQRKYWDAEACADAIRARGQA
jgi:hypothetical protein